MTFPAIAAAATSSSLPPPVNVEAIAAKQAASSSAATIIDCHGHYTTEPEALLDWRKRQIAAIGDRSQMPTVDQLKVNDDELAHLGRGCPAQAAARARHVGDAV